MIEIEPRDEVALAQWLAGLTGLDRATEKRPMVNPTHAELIRNLGPLLWGTRWKTDMALSLGVNDRTVRRWVSGAAVPHPGVWRSLLQIVRQRQHELDELSAAISERAETEE
jgi:hypothetical protein